MAVLAREVVDRSVTERNRWAWPGELNLCICRTHLAVSRPIAAKLITHKLTQAVLLPFKKIKEKLYCSALLSPTLHENVQRITILIHYPPVIMLLAVYLEKNFIQKPRIACPTLSPANLLSVGWHKVLAPSANGLVEAFKAMTGQDFTSRKLKLNRGYSQTAWLVISPGNQNP
uniref:Uncharacterized protein n=1 Tax=Magnetococcus massalia (strain MO-1) TaxID=451514 RepID=A0A1S7LIK7_MAGMO|nr:protein of unknown function [Candidatus Magnetococcus massalia]